MCCTLAAAGVSVGAVGERPIVWENSGGGLLLFVDFALGAMVLRVSSMDANEIVVEVGVRWR